MFENIYKKSIPYCTGQDRTGQDRILNGVRSSFVGLNSGAISVGNLFVCRLLSGGWAGPVQQVGKVIYCTYVLIQMDNIFTLCTWKSF